MGLAVAYYKNQFLGIFDATSISMRINEIAVNLYFVFHLSQPSARPRSLERGYKLAEETTAPNGARLN
ncbi:hypothetical protein [Spirobacillus cienkowskii]|uniref:hypothetical protein n=1 Tax=Spirobacillus cienkowskii TaxID=495820 RepID=UPI0030D2FBF3